ncbi:replication initiation protein RepC, partial [bacterium M00.F.Ca.ET.162.01.1.1]
KRFRGIVEAIPRRASTPELEPVVADLAALHEEVDKLLETHMKSTNPSGNDSQNERQQSDSNTDSIFESEPALEKSGATAEPRTRTAGRPKTYPLGLVLKVCPEIADYAVAGIG